MASQMKIVFTDVVKNILPASSELLGIYICMPFPGLEHQTLPKLLSHMVIQKGTPLDFFVKTASPA